MYDTQKEIEMEREREQMSDTQKEIEVERERVDV